MLKSGSRHACSSDAPDRTLAGLRAGFAPPANARAKMAARSGRRARRVAHQRRTGTPRHAALLSSSRKRSQHVSSLPRDDECVRRA